MLSHEDKEKAISLGEELGRFVNIMGGDEQMMMEFAQKVVHGTHRTLQQNIMRVFIECIKLWAEDYKAGRYDLRNEATCKLAAEIVEKFRDEIYLPCV